MEVHTRKKSKQLGICAKYCRGKSAVSLSTASSAKMLEKIRFVVESRVSTHSCVGYICTAMKHVFSRMAPMMPHSNALWLTSRKQLRRSAFSGGLTTATGRTRSSSLRVSTHSRWGSFIEAEPERSSRSRLKVSMTTPRGGVRDWY